MLGVLLGFARGVAKSALGKVAEKLDKGLSREGLERALSDNSARWGCDDDVTGEKARRFAARYRDAGRTIWGDDPGRH